MSGQLELEALAEVGLRVAAIQVETRLDAAKERNGHSVAMGLLLAASVVSYMRAGAEAIDALRNSARSWRCFHCNEVFLSREAAWLHFGPEGNALHSEPPACVHPLRYDELERCRELAAARANIEQAERDWEEADHVAYRLHSLETDLKRYFKGAETVHQAFQLLDTMEGRALAAEERAAAAEARLAALERGEAA